MALLLSFCYTITGAIRRWLKTQAAAKMGATIEAMYPQRQKKNAPVRKSIAYGMN